MTTASVVSVKPGSPALSGGASGQSSGFQGGGFAAVVGATPPAPASAISLSIDGPPSTPPLADTGESEGDSGYRSFATECAAQAHSFVQQLAGYANLRVPMVAPDFPDVGQQPQINTLDPPNINVPTVAPNSLPSFTLPAFATAAVFPAAPIQPALTFPNAPGGPDIGPVPNAPTVDLNFVYPTVDVVLPDAPPLLSLNVQPFKGVDFPTLSATAPTLTAIEPTPLSFIPAAPYTDGLLTSLKDVLQKRLDTGNTGRNTGLPAIVEEGIWNRGREREYKAQALAIADLQRMEVMGYALPPGAYIDARIKIQTETDYVLAGQSRDVAVEQAKLEQANIKDALEQATAIEGKLIEYENLREQRQFDAVKYTTEAGISIYNAKVQGYTAMVTAYRASIEVFTAQIEGAKAQVQIYTAEIEAEKLKVDANAVLVNSYKVRVDAALASIQVFEGEIQLVKTRAEVEQLKVSVFGEQIRSYTAQAQLYTAEVEAYKAGVEATSVKQAAYASAASAYAAICGTVAKEIDAGIQVYEAQIKTAELQVEAYKAQVSANAEQIRSAASIAEVSASVYSATVSGQSAYNNALVESYKAQTTIALQTAQVGVAAAEANGKLAIAAAQVGSDAAKVAAQVESQLGAAALSANTFATHRSRTDSVSYGQSVSFGNSRSMSQSSSTSESVSTAYATSASVSATTTSSSSFSNNTNTSEAE